VKISLRLGLEYIPLLICLANVLFCADTSAGGKWIRHEVIDKMTDKKTIYFELPSNEKKGNASIAMVAIMCRPDATVGPASRAVYFGNESLSGDTSVLAQVRVDKEPAYFSEWQKMTSQSAAMDNKTAHSLLSGAALMLRLPTLSERFVESTFALTGLNVYQVKKACGPEVFPP
jgi:hypothetical protein